MSQRDCSPLRTLRKGVTERDLRLFKDDGLAPMLWRLSAAVFMIQQTLFVRFQSLPLALEAPLPTALLPQPLRQPPSEETVKCLHSYINRLVKPKKLIKLNIKNPNINNINT